MRRPARSRLAGAVLALGLLAGCELGDIEAAFEFALFEDSADPEVQEVVEKQRQARALREAEAARRAFLTSGDPAQLAEALRLNPNNAELHAFAFALTEPKSAAAKKTQDDLLRIIGDQLRAEKAKVTPAPPTGATTTQVSTAAITTKAASTLLDAMARMVIERAPTGGLGPPRSVLCGQYVGALRTAQALYGEDSVREHRAIFGDPCN